MNKKKEAIIGFGGMGGWHAIKTRYFAYILAIVLLFSFTACVVNPAEDLDSTESESKIPIDTSISDETKDPDFICDLPDNLDYGKKEINILCIQAPGRDDELICENYGNGIVSDAVFERNTLVENELNVKLVFVPEEDDTTAQATITTVVNGGDRTLDIFTIGTNWCITPATQGCYLNLNEVEYIDLDKHYWSQDYNEMMTFTSDKKQFVATSPAALSLFRFAYLTIFNRDLFEDYKIPDLYDTVKKGEWTLDYQNSLLTGMWTDKNGDGQKSEDDLYGFVSGACVSLDAYVVASNAKMVVRDPNTGDLVFNADDFNKIVEMADKVSSIFTDQGTYFFEHDLDQIGENYIMGKFSEAEALMATTQFLGLELNISSLATLNYGIVPMPKLSVEQKNYNTYVQDQVTSFGISSTQIDEEKVEMLGAVLEAIAYYSNETVRPAYYDSALSLRFMQDPESRSILDVMFETITFDYCSATGAGGIRSDLRLTLCKPNPAIASKYKNWERSVNERLKQDNAALDKLQK